jgi:DNA/RNA-binding domain of Phe-tRNA-synthetase-like protein
VSVDDPELREGWLQPDLAAELPGLRLAWTTVPAPAARRSPALRERLELLSDRFRGARALTMRREPVPAAYRVFFRHVGLDPDVHRTPVEAAVLERLMHGGWASREILDDALLLAVLETAVPVWALDHDRVDGPLGLRTAAPGERVGEGPQAPGLPGGRVVVADARRPVAVLFGAIAPSLVHGHATTSLDLFTVGVAGVPALYVDEALAQCADALGGG